MIKLILKVLIIGISISSLVYFFDKNIYEFLIKEDGIYENITALVMLLISILIIIRLIKTTPKNKQWIVYNVFLAIICFFVFGEEISWGQRIFSIETGDFFSEHNLQGETNLHNLKINGVKLNKLIFSTGLSIVGGFYFLALFPLYKNNNFVKRQADQFGIHIPKLEHTILLVISTIIIVLIPDNKKWELWETVSVLVFFLILLDPFNKKEALLSKENKTL